MRKRSSTSAMTSCDSIPHREISRSFETERITSHKIALSLLVPPSPLPTFTCSGISRWVEVCGKTTTKSAGPALKKSTERTRTVCGHFVPGHASNEDQRARFRRGADRPYRLKSRRLEGHPIDELRAQRNAMTFVPISGLAQISLGPRPNDEAPFHPWITF